LIEGYDTVILIAWSLGVYAASRYLPPCNVTSAIAVNGTEWPVSDLYGIPSDVFKGTMENLDERNLLKFRKRMTGKSFGALMERFSSAPVGDLKRELKAILDSCVKPDGGYAEIEGEATEKDAHKIRWDRIYLSTDDRIFPYRNQKRWWERRGYADSIIEIGGDHYVDFPRLVASLFPSRRKVATRFSRALPTYDDNAGAQRQIALRLADFIRRQGVGRIEKMLEIGGGSGLFSRIMGEMFNPSEATFIDLYPVPKLGIAPDERYIVADAEEWVEEEASGNTGAYDAVVSASAMQWFIDPERFIVNAGRLLKPGGFLGVSTFLPGNLKELTPVNPFGLLYLPADRLETMFRNHFRNVRIEHTSIEMKFLSSRELLRHLKLTGVGGEGGAGVTLREMLSTLPDRLTYYPAFIFASEFKKSIN
ncbi:MAG: DUF452 family protein, partial [Muribaculaceae bacterium]|nr:DUF452 family protein [Muribaculaceae bacterium]